MRKKENTSPAVKKEKPLQYTHSFKINRSNELLPFLLSKLDLSRNSIKALLSSHKVLVNGTVVSQFNYALSKDDEVKIAKAPVKVTPIAKPSKKAKGIPSHLKGKILYEDDVFIAINKPSGLLSVESDTDRNSAYALVADYLKIKDPKARPYVLHRIDRDTSGVLVFAKDIKVHSKLKMHWNQDIKKREYIAVVEGKMEDKEKTLVSYLKENSNNMVFVSKDRNGKKAITHYEVMAENAKYSLLRIIIDTGRKNQIRVQMASIGHPIVGESKYVENPDMSLNRMGLHASELDFIHPLSQELIQIKAPVPGEFKALFPRKQKEKK